MRLLRFARNDGILNEIPQSSWGMTQSLGNFERDCFASLAMTAILDGILKI
ncbi:hypothetical protein [Campylobacter sp.]|uniref:hypothetical protein n=1 Tax=Campylobacter sp. TaxID=205 RepID=UPI002A6216CF|nr:hypothetical protein [Campylobacter sp.]MDD7703316.1 hypothetical protein [Campylobacteraceae bacterium]MDY2634898.1 hypothetical protein [Campylobacter sp.]